jgi:hypothetical protein
VASQGYQQRYVTVRVLGELGRRALAENTADPGTLNREIEDDYHHG